MRRTTTTPPSIRSSMERANLVARIAAGSSYGPFPGGGAGDRPRIDYSGVEPHPADEVVERLAWLMDNSIPLAGGYRIGLDPLLGLVPGLGDVVGALVSGTIIVQAHRAGVPRATITRMLANIAIDSGLGAIPLAGDLFDFAFKANTKNLELYRSARRGTHSRASDILFLAAVLLGVMVAVSIPVLLVWLAWTAFTGLR